MNINANVDGMSRGDPNGIINANDAIAAVNGVFFDFDGINSDLISELNLIVDSSGMLSVKVTEGLEKISSSLSGVKSNKTNLIATIQEEGQSLVKQHNDYVAYVNYLNNISNGVSKNISNSQKLDDLKNQINSKKNSYTFGPRKNSNTSRGSTQFLN